MNKLFSKVFMWMAIGLLVTFATGLFVSTNEVMLENVFSTTGYIIFAIIEIVLVIVLAARVLKMKPTTAKAAFILYSFVSGLTFSSIFVYYSLSSIIYVFLVSALLFAILAMVGYTTKADLSKLGTYLCVGLLAIIIISLFGFIFNLSQLDIILSIASVVIFLGITAYDIQKIKQLEHSGLPEDNLAIYGALDLYLDLINIFLNLLSIFGKSDN